MPQPEYFHDNESLQREIARTRELLARCKEVLQQPLPDTFLGRHRHEPIPPSYDEAVDLGTDGSRQASDTDKTA